MTRLTIPAAEVRKGDVIDFGGQPVTVLDNAYAPPEVTP